MSAERVIDAEWFTPPENEGAPGAELAVVEPDLDGMLPTVPAENELRTLSQLAVTLASAQLVPKALHNRPQDVLLVLLTGRDLGITATTALRECHPIDGKVTVSPKLKMAVVRQRGIGRIWPEAGNDAVAATWHAVRADDPTGTVISSTWTMADAETAKLTRKDNWQKYPARMLSWRALGYLLDDVFPEVGTGLYSPDELGAVTDEDGRVIDVTDTTGPLEGMPEAATRPAGNAHPNAVAPDHVRGELQQRIKALPEWAVDALRERWQRPDKDGRPAFPPLGQLPNRLVRAATALVEVIEQEVAARAAESPGDAPEAAEGTEGPEPAPGPVDGDLGADPPEWAVDAVAGMEVIDVEDQLTAAGLDVTGDADRDRRRLAQLIAEDDS